jgi:asparagine synthase (glutamine-hydrolysing)
MAHSLETRVPFLDDDLVDFACRLPTHLKIRDLTTVVPLDENEPGKRYFKEDSTDGKLILRRAMSALLPADVRGRRKQGFSAPDASWFRGQSIDYIDRLLRDRKAMIYDLLEPAYVHRTLDEHESGRVNHRLRIWSFLSLEWWCRIFLSGAALDAADPGRSFATREP